MSGGRLRVNIVSGKDHLEAYGDSEGDQTHRYTRTRELMQLVRRWWTEENVTYRGEHFQVSESTVVPRIDATAGRRHPKLCFGGGAATTWLVGSAQDVASSMRK